MKTVSIHQRLAHKAWVILFTCLFIGTTICGSPAPVSAKAALQTAVPDLAITQIAESLQPASQVYAAEPQTGIDCGCSATGPYVEPSAPTPISITTQPTESPNHKYQVEWQYGSGQITSLSVKRVSDNREIVWLGALPNSTYWNFSPEDDRFAIYTIQGSQTTYYLYNLVRATNPGSPIWDTTTSLVVTDAAFSPNGQYFQYVIADSLGISTQ